MDCHNDMKNPDVRHVQVISSLLNVSVIHTERQDDSYIHVFVFFNEIRLSFRFLNISMAENLGTLLKTTVAICSEKLA